MDSSPSTATATFTIEMTPSSPVIDGTARIDFTKSWEGALTGASTGVMLSGGDPGSGNAGYVALEVFSGTLDGKAGTVTLQQFGTMIGSEVVLNYEVVPGSGTDELSGITGSIDLDIVDGVHHVTLTFSQ